jgi:hypothetical protein
MAREVYRSSFNLEKVKHVLDKPVVIDEVPYWLESEGWSESKGSGYSNGASSTWSSGTGESGGLAERYSAIGADPYEAVVSTGETMNEGSGGGSSYSESWSSSSGYAHGRSQTLKSVRVTMPTAVYSVDEQLHLAIVKLRELPNQAAIVKRRGSPPVRFRPSTVKPPLAWADLIGTFLNDTRAASPYIAASHDADAEIAARVVVAGPARSAQSPAADAGGDAFWSE